MRTTKPLKGYACIIRDAEFPETVECGDGVPYTVDVKHGGVRAWLQFKDAVTMRKLGQSLIEFADLMEEMYDKN